VEFLPNSGHAVPRWEESSAVTFQRAFRPFRFHDLRHAFAVNALKSGMSIYSLSNGSIGSLKRERAIVTAAPRGSRNQRACRGRPLHALLEAAFKILWDNAQR
jgi:hypothetical protein